MYLHNDLIGAIWQAIPLGLVYQKENRFALWVYSVLLQMYDPYRDQEFTFKQIASYGNFFKSDTPSTKSLEQIREAVSYLAANGYILINEDSMATYTEKINKASFVCSICPASELIFGNRSYVKIKCREIGKLLDLAKEMNGSNIRCSMSTLLRVYYYLRHDLEYYEDRQKKDPHRLNNFDHEEYCGYSGLFTLAKKKLGITEQNLSRTLNVMKHYKVISIRYGLRKEKGEDPMVRGGLFVAPAKTNVIMFNYLANKKDAEDMMFKICSRYSELTNASYFWSLSNTKNDHGFSTEPPLHARLLRG